ncbi:hypothetical protein C8F04DRAFT_1179246 [Mycena alexandri]|uniref:Uncharacterized protein n=1 Tax=Mycena alexandri TaxID=1745969 RepID=A0AAD6T3R2_9AGAR|nr:hypothetical protein C8F04DRAFT_1179246 [Mycena alexandri]
MPRSNSVRVPRKAEIVADAQAWSTGPAANGTALGSQVFGSWGTPSASVSGWEQPVSSDDEVPWGTWTASSWAAWTGNPLSSWPASSTAEEAHAEAALAPWDGAQASYSEKKHYKSVVRVSSETQTDLQNGRRREEKKKNEKRVKGKWAAKGYGRIRTDKFWLRKQTHYAGASRPDPSPTFSMPPTAGDKARAGIQKRVDRMRRKKHAIAQSKYRERNMDVLREKARESMKRHRAAIKESEEKTKAAREQRREVDADYRERQRQKMRRDQMPKEDGCDGEGVGWGATPTLLECVRDYHVTPSQLPSAMIPRLRVPPAIAALAAPPANFVPCRLHEAFSGNFKNHADFSRQGNKTYWVVFSWAREAVFTLKADCLAGKEPKDDVVGSFAEWADVVRVWAAFCYHHHGKCERHPRSCARSMCPAHPRPYDPPAEPGRRDPRVKLEVKVEVGVGVKRERATPRLETPKHRRAETSMRRVPVSHTPVPQSPSDGYDSDVVEPGGVPLWAPDTPPARREEARGEWRCGRGSRSRHAGTTDSSRAQSTAATSPPTTTLSSASSLSASTVETAAPAGKGKERAIYPLASTSSISRAAPARSSTSHAAVPARPTTSHAAVPAIPRAASPRTVASTSNASTSRVVRLNDPFFVSAAGMIRVTSEAAFADIGEGPVKVVVGWEAATKYAVELAEKEAARAEPSLRRFLRLPVCPSCKMPNVKSRVDKEKWRFLESHLPNFLNAARLRKTSEFFEWVWGYYYHRFGVASLNTKIRAWYRFQGLRRRHRVEA